MHWRLWLVIFGLFSLAADAAPPHLSSRYAELAYDSETSFLLDLRRGRDPKQLNAPGARYREPFIGKTQLSWTDDVVVITQGARFQGQPYHLVYFIAGTSSKPLFKDRRVLFECKLAGAMSSQTAIKRCRHDVERRH